jgi:hypothetical protein
MFEKFEKFELFEMFEMFEVFQWFWVVKILGCESFEFGVRGFTAKCCWIEQ